MSNDKRYSSKKLTEKKWGIYDKDIESPLRIVHSEEDATTVVDLANELDDLVNKENKDD